MQQRDWAGVYYWMTIWDKMSFFVVCSLENAFIVGGFFLCWFFCFRRHTYWRRFVTVKRDDCHGCNRRSLRANRKRVVRAGTQAQPCFFFLVGCWGLARFPECECRKSLWMGFLWHTVPRLLLRSLNVRVVERTPKSRLVGHRCKHSCVHNASSTPDRKRKINEWHVGLTWW